MSKQRYEKAQIEEWILGFKTSGLTPDEYSKDKPFHVSTLRYWIFRSKPKVATQKERAFVEVSAIQGTNSVIYTSDGSRIDLGYRLSVDQLKTILR